ncbi:MAG: hypothetical protein J2P17_08565, partial [Mycobacterium sp.]|nr:hypothetical protein [Mycobacterium sp.]
MPMNGDDIYDNFNGLAHGPEDYNLAQDSIIKANNLIGEAGQEVKAHADKLNSFWKGDAAEGAKQGLMPIAYEAQYNTDHADMARNMLQQ